MQSKTPSRRRLLLQLLPTLLVAAANVGAVAGGAVKGL